MAPTTTLIVTDFIDGQPGVRSIIGLFNVLLGLMVALIIGQFSKLILVPIIVSAACAVANGLNYYLQADYPALNQAVASPFADITWLIQELGLNFYSYAILAHIISGTERLVFMTLFWVLVLGITCIRIGIVVVRILSILENNSPILRLHLGYLHIGYFTSIAAVECISAVFLLKSLRTTIRSSRVLPTGSRFHYHLLRTTEIRLSTLALIGIMRAVAYPCKFIFGSHGIASNLDNFGSLMESLFPMVMYLDILGSRLVYAYESSARTNTLGNGNALQMLYHSTKSA